MKSSAANQRKQRSTLGNANRNTKAFPARALVLALCLVASVFAIYSPSLQFQFILDDHRFTSDPRIAQAGHLWDYFANYVWAQFTGGPPSFYRPLFLVWMRVNFVVSALTPWGWHFLSIAKHVFVAALLGLVAWELLRDSFAALVAAWLFALHPAQTESVSWVTVPDPLMSAGVLVALLLYLKYVESPSKTGNRTQRNRPRKTSLVATSQRSAAWLIASATAYFAALLTKESAIVFPVVIVGLGLCIARDSSEKLRSNSEHAGLSARLGRVLHHIAPFAVVTALYFVLRMNALRGKLAAVTQHLPWSTVVLSWPATLWFYVKVLLWPARSYSFADPTLVESFTVRGVLLPLLGLSCAAAILAGTCYWAWTKVRRELDQQEAAGVQSALTAGTLLLVLPLLLTLDLDVLNPGDFLHGRYTYLPLAGLMLLVATVLRLIPKMRIAVLCTVGGLSVAFGALTLLQQGQWKDDATVFTIAHQLAPHNRAVARNLADTQVRSALQLSEEGRCSEAMPIFQQVIHDYSDDWFAWAGAGDCFFQLRDLAQAEKSLHRAADLSHDPRVIQHWQELRVHMGLSSSTAEN